jgi:2'-5' RNA ligase
MEGNAEVPDRGWFALVYYVPDPLRSVVHQIRQLIPSGQLPPAHVTVLPPRPLKAPASAICREIERRLAHTTAFEVTLTDIGYFTETDFIYIEIAEGAAKLREIHNTLNNGELLNYEPFEFHPHVTVAGPIPQELVQQTRDAASAAWQEVSCPCSLVVDEIVCLWRAKQHEPDGWRKIGAFSLPATHSQAAAGTTGRT